MRFSVKKFLTLALSLGLLGAGLSSCSTVASGIEHSHLEVQAKMSQSIFLEPSNEKTVYIQVHNTSQVPINLYDDVASAMRAKGYEVVSDPYKAYYWIQANVLYMGKQSQHMTMAGMLAGGYGGALLGSTMGTGWRAQAGTIGAGALVGSAIGALAGAAIHVDTYIGVVDVQVKEKVNGEIESTTSSNIQQGNSTTVHTVYKTKTQYKSYRTRIGVSATRTNINIKEAVPIIENKVSQEIAGIF